MKTAFIGHRKLLGKDIGERLISAIEKEIINGSKTFTMGMHGDFDNLALWACRQLRNKYSDIEIEVVITSLHSIEKYNDWGYRHFSDVKTVMYEIENAHYKQQITISNRLMIDTCDTLICYVDESAYRSGAKTAMHYATRKGLKIINLWREEDKPFYGMSEEEIDTCMKEFFAKS